MLGSCFTEHIGQRLIQNKFQAVVNPFGVVYNPASIFEQLRCAMSELESPCSAQDGSILFRNDGIWNSWLHDSSFSNYVFSKRHSILARDTFFVVYAPTHYLEKNKAFLEQLAKEKLCKFFLPDEIHRHIFLIDSETGDGFGCLVVALQDQQTTAK